jgi:glycerate 2-kinase
LATKFSKGKTMRVLIAPDKFKSCMSATEAAAMIASGVKAVYPDAEIIEMPLSDGGEGLLDVLAGGRDGQIQHTIVTGPLGNSVKARWGLIDKSKTAVIEMAEASGLALVPETLRNPTLTTTYGTGELIKAALDKGCTKLIVGIGGSATNDGGTGMARALGAVFTDQQDRELKGGGVELVKLEKIDVSGLDQRLKLVKTVVASDVDNPLTGPQGASYTYAPQKGATPEMVELLDKAMNHYSEVVRRDLGCAIAKVKGAGAAGGLGAGLIVFLDAELQPGVNLVLDQVGFSSSLQGCNLVITGEGKLDRQTVYGKVPVGVARRARESKVPVIALTGSLRAAPFTLHAEGITAFFALADGPLSIEESINRGPELLKKKTLELMLLWKAAAGNAL